MNELPKKPQPVELREWESWPDPNAKPWPTHKSILLAAEAFGIVIGCFAASFITSNSEFTSIFGFGVLVGWATCRFIIPEIE